MVENLEERMKGIENALRERSRRAFAVGSVFVILILVAITIGGVGVHNIADNAETSARLNDDVDNLESDHLGLKHQIRPLSAEIRTLKGSNNNLVAKNSALYKKVSDLETSNTDLASRISKLQCIHENCN